MRRIIAWAALGLLAASGAASDAAAQYYRPPREYYEPPPAYYQPPPPHYPRHALGGRCDSRLLTADGPRSLVCDIVRPRLLGQPCVCPPPPSPPGYRPGPYLNGRVVP